MFFNILIYLALLGKLFVVADFGTEYENNQDASNLPIINGDREELLLFATLDGTLTAVDHRSGQVRWKLNNEPVVKVPVDTRSAIFPIFLPDPKDGSLYLLNFGETNLLKKFPFSIQQLVATSPCRSNDGVFYSGKKIDSWWSIDTKTGKKTPLFGSDQDSSCPIPSKDSLVIGRTEYKITMYDSKNENSHSNITYYDYSSQVLSAEEASSYGYLHVSGSSSGKVKTLDRLTGAVLWELDLSSPLVAIYMSKNQEIFSLPFKTVADPILDKLPFFHSTMYSTLYVGEHTHGFYAFPALADSNTRVLPNYRPPILLIDGPYRPSNPIPTGHYQLPDLSKTQLLIAGRSDPIIVPNNTVVNTTRKSTLKPETLEVHTEAGLGLHSQSTEHRLLLAAVMILLISVIAMFLYFKAQVRDMQLSSGSSGGSSASCCSSNASQKGIITVGKISFNTKHVLGKGCEGTFVFRGEFDGRQVAVKRVLPDCFSLVDREVALLRESDTHPNVIRYFCTESDPQFYYIALELASATLQDYVEKGAHTNEVDQTEVLKQATHGLDHLHSLQIVHRDVKPHNILLSRRNGDHRVRALISDFGLCKKLQNGKASFSRRSGVTGTEGWIAPEMIDATARTMCAVDIFSLGCVFHYVLSGGKHPFGEPLKRQANILSGEYRLNLLENELWESLVSAMLNKDPSIRPSSDVIKSHPVFWDHAHTLAFLQDVSDRMEKEGNESKGLRLIESDGEHVYREDWRLFIEPPVAADLRKYRSYRGNSVRDLLRALRNKKHHIRELPIEAQQLLGESAESYVSYWTSRFPRLLYHTWSSLQPLRDEPLLQKYYPLSGYEFACDKSGELPEWLSEGSPIKKVCSSPEMESWARGGAGTWRPRTSRPRPRHRHQPSQPTDPP